MSVLEKQLDAVERKLLWKLKGKKRLVIIWKNGSLYKAGIENLQGKIVFLRTKRETKAAYKLWVDNWVEQRAPHGEITEKFTVALKGRERISKWEYGEKIMKEIKTRK